MAESYANLRVYGLDPTSGLLQDIGHAASAIARTMLQGVEAIADALRGISSGSSSSLTSMPRSRVARSNTAGGT